MQVAVETPRANLLTKYIVQSPSGKYIVARLDKDPRHYTEIEGLTM
jgi:hypothetical protein